jgi:hypothetical protein
MLEKHIKIGKDLFHHPYAVESASPTEGTNCTNVSLLEFLPFLVKFG